MNTQFVYDECVKFGWDKEFIKKMIAIGVYISPKYYTKKEEEQDDGE